MSANGAATAACLRRLSVPLEQCQPLDSNAPRNVAPAHASGPVAPAKLPAPDTVGLQWFTLRMRALRRERSDVEVDHVHRNQVEE
jgi:hypothetical protein